MKIKERKDEIASLISDYIQLEHTDDKEGEQARQMFIAWLDHGEELEQKEQVLQDLVERQPKPKHTYMNEERLSAMFERMGFEESQPVVAPWRSWRMVAAVLLPLMLLGGAALWLAMRSQGKSYMAQLHTQYGQIVPQEWLGDSSSVSLNAGSQLLVKHTKDLRLVELTGESRFSIRRDVKRPFVVQTQDLRVEVLGTEFNVEAYPDSPSTVVTLQSGKVQVTTPQGVQYVLKPNQQLVYNRHTHKVSIVDLSHSATAEVVEWVQGALVLHDLTMREAIKLLERHYNVSIKVADTAHLEDRIMSKFAAEVTPEEAMMQLSLVVPGLEYEIVK